ncbi:hypothetical protein [Salibacter halophilus]|uniref:Uncharacterized protein n=1 Tax=Salibacter halophilus TaxID=1803916 RepID=A0A6N6MA38_9FLAO|nr:hypothetical protein [Salibacter halophilus]KAB1065580.1 hypothetical protein F3059_02700 [Salibacter halophilus]
MRVRLIQIIITLTMISSCATIPKETVELSKVLGNDLAILHKSHRNMVELYYGKLANDINSFINDVYSPFVIHYVLKDQMEKYKNGKSSIYSTIETAGKTGGKAETQNAVNDMTEFFEDAKKQIEAKRSELLNPVMKQKRELLNKIDESYENALLANANLTGYLQSIRKVKESQKEALGIIGLEGKDKDLNNMLLRTSETLSTSLEKAKEIDVKSDDAIQKIKDISDKIKSITNKN